MSRESLRDFVASHDERWLFVVIYISLAVVLSIVLSLFWLVAVAALHFTFEYMRQAQTRTGIGDIVSHAIWEIKLDIALVVLALAMSLYMDVVLGILGLQSAARAAAATRVVRFTAWERNVRAIVLLSDDLGRVIQIAWTRLLRRPASPAVVTANADRSSAAVPLAAAATASAEARPAAPVRERAPEPAAPATPVPSPSWRDAWTTGDRVTLALLVASVLLIVVAPLVTDHSWAGATTTLLQELRPFPQK
jgi:hypothetical protein